MTEWCRCTVLFIALLHFCHEAGFHVKGDELGTLVSPKDATMDASNLKLLWFSDNEQSKGHGVDPPTFWNKFALRRREMTAYQSLGDLVLHVGGTDISGTNTSNSTQVSLSSSNGRSWCIAKSSAKPDPLQSALDWACGLIGGADCEPIQLGNACFLPNTVYSHASYAFNSYYQIHQHAAGTCDFLGVATIVYDDPSYAGCSYPYRSGQPGASVVVGQSSSPMASLSIFTHMSVIVSILLSMSIIM